MRSAAATSSALSPAGTRSTVPGNPGQHDPDLPEQKVRSTTPIGVADESTHRAHTGAFAARLPLPRVGLPVPPSLCPESLIHVLPFG